MEGGGCSQGSRESLLTWFPNPQKISEESTTTSRSQSCRQAKPPTSETTTARTAEKNCFKQFIKAWDSSRQGDPSSGTVFSMWQNILYTSKAYGAHENHPHSPKTASGPSGAKIHQQPPGLENPSFRLGDQRINQGDAAANPPSP